MSTKMKDQRVDQAAYEKARYLAVRDVCEDNLAEIQRGTAEHYVALTGEPLPAVWVNL